MIKYKAIHDQVRPDGAIDIYRFLELVALSNIHPQNFYRASKKFGVYLKVLDHACIHTAGNTANGYEYIYIGYKSSPNDPFAESLKDANIIPNEYNDWFPFEDLEKAEQYAGQPLKA